MTALEEIKESTRGSLEAKQHELLDLVGAGHEQDIALRDAILDVISQALVMYKMTVAQIRVAESIDEVAELWHELHGVYSSTLVLWQGLDAVFGKTARGELFEYCKATIQKLERASAQAYEFHA
jgi:hypothetical protein